MNTTTPLSGTTCIHGRLPSALERCLDKLRRGGLVAARSACVSPANRGIDDLGDPTDTQVTCSNLTRLRRTEQDCSTSEAPPHDRIAPENRDPIPTPTRSGGWGPRMQSADLIIDERSTHFSVGSAIGIRHQASLGIPFNAFDSATNPTPSPAPLAGFDPPLRPPPNSLIPGRAAPDADRMTDPPLAPRRSRIVRSPSRSHS